MSKEKWLPLVIIASIIGPCRPEDNATTFASRRKYLEEQAINTYRSACLRLQKMTNWISVFLKLKSAWTHTATKSITANPDLKIDLSNRNIPKLPKRPTMGREGSDCSSLRNFRVTLQTYIHYQALLLQLKGVLGSAMLQSSKSRLGDTSTTLMNIGSLDVLNKTSVDIFEKLKQSSQFLSTLDNMETLNILSSIKDIQNGSNLENVQEQKSNIFRQIQEVTKNAQNLRTTRSLLQTSNFFQTLGIALDNLFTPKNTFP